MVALYLFFFNTGNFNLKKVVFGKYFHLIPMANEIFRK